MEVLEEIQEVVDKLNEIDKYSDSLNDKLSILDTKQQDLLHYIENNSINVLWCYKMIREIKTIRESRRKVKNDMDILSKYSEQKSKLISRDNRQFLIAELHKKEKMLGKKYTNKQYTEKELDEILGKGVANV